MNSDPEHSSYPSYSYPTIPQPKNLKVPLFPHQLTSVYNMEKLETEKVCYNTDRTTMTTCIGINADMVGYGKTLSMVALILRDRMEWGSKTYTREHTNTIHGFITITNRDVLPTIDTTLVLAGTSIIPQWITELKKAPTLRVATITKKVCLLSPISDYDVIIVSPSLFNQFIDAHNYAWKRFIYDEPTTAKIPSMRYITAGFTWLITATPQGLIPVYSRVRPSFMRTVISFLIDYRDFITVKNPDDYVKKSFSMPETKYVYHKCYSGIYRHVDGIINKKIKQMIETGNIEGAILSLGGKNTDNIMELVKKNKNLEIEEINSKIRLWTLRGDTGKITEWGNRLKVAQHQLEEIEKRFSAYMESNCPICTEIIHKPVMEPKCQNLFCGKCLMKWVSLKHTCPMCRVELSESSLVYIRKENDSEEKGLQEEIQKTKEDTIVDIIKKNKKGKYIVFSDFSGSFDTIRNVFKGHDISFVELKGATETRGKKLDMFKKGDTSVIFLNSKIDSTGLNIQEATDIILYHTMDDDTSRQIIGRANRMGRKGSLTVHYLQL